MGISFEEKDFYDIFAKVQDGYSFPFANEKCMELTKKIKWCGIKKLTTYSQEYIMRKTCFHWEDVTVDHIMMNALDDESFKIFRKEALRKKRIIEVELNVSKDVSDVRGQTEVFGSTPVL